ncbi:MAG: ABC transporter permease [Magnetococcales bacterium]|nr:ABC transporter permease [Magnetococcales bacterium]
MAATPSASNPQQSSLLEPIRALGEYCLNTVHQMGCMFIFLLAAIKQMVLPPFRPRTLMAQIHFIGIRSLFVIILTGAFVGMVLALQGYYTLSRFGSEAMLGPAVAASIIRELGPVLSGIMVTGRAGSALTTKLGMMRVTEQIDALETMGINSMKLLVTPAIEATLISLPLLNVIFCVVGIYGGYLVAVQLLGLSQGTYFGGIETAIVAKDITVSLIKSVCFGLIIAWICTFKGYFTQRGAEGLGSAMTSAVVLCSVLILVSDYFITALML